MRESELEHHHDSPVDAVASTALWMAAVRARETARPDRLFSDPLAEVLADVQGVRLMTQMEAGLPDNPTIPIRTRYIDDRLCAMVEDEAVSQVVLVGAGMDARAFRLGLPATVVVFEVDQPALLEVKQQRLDEVGVRPSCRRHVVPADLDDRWHEALEAAGFESGEPAVFVAEGLLGYLDARQVHELLNVLADLAAPGSALLADVSGRVPADAAPFMDPWFARLAAVGIQRRFATDDPEGLFDAHGWDAEVAQYGDDGANFGRWPWPVLPREETNWPHNYLITAHRRSRQP